MGGGIFCHPNLRVTFPTCSTFGDVFRAVFFFFFRGLKVKMGYGVTKWDPFGRDQMMQVYGNFEGFPLEECIVWVENILITMGLRFSASKSNIF